MRAVKPVLCAALVALLAGGPADAWASGLVNALKTVKSHVARTIEYREISHLLLPPKSYHKVVAEIVRQAERRYYDRGQELTPEARAQLIASLNTNDGSGHLELPRSVKRHVNSTTVHLHHNDQAETLEIRDVAPTVPREIVVSADLPSTPIFWERGEKGFTGTLKDYFRDLRAPVDAAGRELHALIAPTIKPTRYTMGLTLPLLLMVHGGLVISSGDIGQMIHFGLIGGSILGVSVGGSLWFGHGRYTDRVNEMKFREPGYLVKHMQHRLRTMPKSTSWSQQEVDTAIHMIDQDLAKRLLEMKAHLRGVSLVAVEQKEAGKKSPQKKAERSYHLMATALVDSPDNSVENYPLVFEISRDDVRPGGALQAGK